jgi:hypothetical protein
MPSAKNVFGRSDVVFDIKDKVLVSHPPFFGYWENEMGEYVNYL